ncbi:hypothetical protein JCM19233_5879 [Vibrio astriarenae]|nr:hypothetical protein JCM19233_5879 [Vibrio sp. C7]
MLGIGHANLAHESDDNISYKAQVDFHVGQAALSYDLYGVDSEVDYEGFGAHMVCL